MTAVRIFGAIRRRRRDRRELNERSVSQLFQYQEMRLCILFLFGKLDSLFSLAGGHKNANIVLVRGELPLLHMLYYCRHVVRTAQPEEWSSLLCTLEYFA